MRFYEKAGGLRYCTGATEGKKSLGFDTIAMALVLCLPGEETHPQWHGSNATRMRFNRCPTTR